MIRIISISNLYDKPALLRVARAPRRAATLVEVSGQVRDRVNKVCVRRSLPYAIYNALFRHRDRLSAVRVSAKCLALLDD